jgi:hypothetical protein
MSQWVEVTFHGLVPTGQTIVDVDIVEVSKNLMEVFGFTHIDGLTVTREERDEWATS